MRILIPTFLNLFTYLINILHVTVLLCCQSLSGHPSHPKRSSVLFAGLSFLLTLELPHPAPGHLPAWMLSLALVGSAACTRLLLSPCVDAPLCLLAPWYPTLASPSSLPDALLTLPCSYVVLPPSSYCAPQPTAAHWVSPGCPGQRHLPSSLASPNGFRTELFLEERVKGKGFYKTF